MKTVNVKYMGNLNLVIHSFGTKTYSFTKNKVREIPVEFYNELSESLPGNFTIESKVTEIKIEEKPIKNFANKHSKKEDK